MHRQVNAIAGRLSLRPPQRRSQEILDRVTEIIPPRRGADRQAALATIKSEFPTVPHDAISENMTLGGLSSQFLIAG